MSAEIPIEQRCGAWNHRRQKRNRRIVRALMEKRTVHLGAEFPDDLEGSIEVSVLNNGKAGALRYHLTAPRKESSHFHGEYRS